MNAGATVRVIRVTWVLLLAALVVGVLSAQEAEATKNTGKYQASISKRAKIAEEICGEHGGTSDVSYSYDADDNLVSANVSCSGGDFNGSNCTYTVETSECFWEPGSRTSTTRPIWTPAGEDAVVQNPEVVRGSGVVGTDVRSPGVADAGAGAPSTPALATEPAIAEEPVS